MGASFRDPVFGQNLVAILNLRLKKCPLFPAPFLGSSEACTNAFALSMLPKAVQDFPVTIVSFVVCVQNSVHSHTLGKHTYRAELKRSPRGTARRGS